MKKYVFLSAALGLLLALFAYSPQTYAAQKTQTYQVVVPELNVRAEPAIDSSIIGSLQNGDHLAVFDKAYGWVQTYYGGQVAWVASQFIVPVEDSNHTLTQQTTTVSHTQSTNGFTEQTYNVEASTLYVRAEPSIDSDIIGTLEHGDQLTAFQKAYGWVQTYYGGQVAWVASPYLSVVDTENVHTIAKQETTTHSSSENGATTEQQNITNHKQPSSVKGTTYTVATSQLNVRAEPSSDSSIVATLENGDRLTVFQESYGWLKTYYGGQAVWVASQFLLPVGQSASSLVQQVKVGNVLTNNLAGKTIVLDAGHGGFDPGAIALDGSHESTYTLDIVRNIASQLRQAGANVILTRETDTFLTLAERVYISEAYHTDVFLSIHLNSYYTQSTHGFSTHFYDSSTRQLAYAMQQGLAQHLATYSRGIVKSNYHVLRENSKPAVLLELGFVTNPGDLAKIKTESYQSNIAAGVLAGLRHYFSES